MPEENQNTFSPESIKKPPVQKKAAEGDDVSLDPTQINTPPPPQGPSAENVIKPRAEEESDILLDISAADTEDKKEKKKYQAKNALDIYHVLNDWVINHSPVKLGDKLLFFQLLGATVHAGISVTESLRLLAKQTKNPRLKYIIEDMHTLIEDGESLADAMKRNDDVFDEATCAIVEAGEKSGKLNEVLKELVKQYEKLSEIQKKVMGIFMYPIIVFIVMILLTIVVMVFVIPKLITLFGDVGNLPMPTRVMIAGSELVRYHTLELAIGVGLIVFGFIAWKKTKVGRRQWATIILHTPLVSQIVREMILSRMTRIFGFLIASGVPIIESLKITAGTTQNPLYEEKLMLASDDLGKGISIAENLADNERLFPSILVNMISIGEKTASLENIMGKIADYYEEELDRIIGNLSKLMEPITLAIIAAGAVFMILAIYLPILSLNDKILG